MYSSSRSFWEFCQKALQEKAQRSNTSTSLLCSFPTFQTLERVFTEAFPQKRAKCWIPKDFLFFLSTTYSSYMSRGGGASVVLVGVKPVG